MDDATTIGYEAEPSDVAAAVEGALADTTDPLERYHRATALQVLHGAVAGGLRRERARLAALLAVAADGEVMPKRRVAEALGLGAPTAQKLIEAGRCGADGPGATCGLPAGHGGDVHRGPVSPTGRWCTWPVVHPAGGGAADGGTS